MNLDSNACPSILRLSAQLTRAGLEWMQVKGNGIIRLRDVRLIRLPRPEGMTRLWLNGSRQVDGEGGVALRSSGTEELPRPSSLTTVSSQSGTLSRYAARVIMWAAMGAVRRTNATMR